MKNKVFIKRILDSSNEKIITKGYTNKNHSSDEKATFKSIFHYKISKECSLINNNSEFCTISWKHSRPINYKNFHECIVPLDWALNLLGYDMFKDDSIWRTKLDCDDIFANKLIKLMNLLKPISANEYSNSYKNV